MRTFYIFNINNDYIRDNKINPYPIYKAFDELHNIKDNNFFTLYDSLISKIDKDSLSSRIYDVYQNDDYYMKFQNTHLYNNYYNHEKTKLEINNSYMKLDTSSIEPEFFKVLKNNQSLFVCDFNNKDYFWLESLA